MLNKVAFANSLAVLTDALYVLFAILALVAPHIFQILFDAQFFGANVASLFPKVQPSAASLVTLVLMIGMSWASDTPGPGCTIGSRRASGHGTTHQIAKERRRCPEAGNELSVTTSIRHRLGDRGRQRGGPGTRGDYARRQEDCSSSRGKAARPTARKQNKKSSQAAAGERARLRAQLLRSAAAAEEERVRRRPKVIHSVRLTRCPG